MSLTGLLTATVHVASHVSVDQYGKNTYGPPRAVAARVQGLRRNVRNRDGDEVVSSHVLYLVEEVKATDRLWLPGASTSSAEASNVPISITSSPHPSSGGLTLWKVEL
ncbi:MAG: hypothetical protein JNJ54_35060 [Myxococcaceae bacterium]|nr:hypothetical protein [Myxococcaceae bacterium]